MPQMVAEVDPSVAQSSVSEQVVALVRQNAALEGRIAACGDAITLQQRLEEERQVGVTAQHRTACVQ
jgi:hypothetical protein